MIKISENAAKHIQNIITAEGHTAETLLRVKVKRGGCSGFSYKLDFDDQQTDADKIFDDNGVKLVIDSESILYLLGMTLDYEGGLNGSGFVFSNPNASKTCGCGASFAV